MHEPINNKATEVAPTEARWNARVKLAQDALSLSREVAVLVLVVLVLGLLLSHVDVIRGLFTHFAEELGKAKLTEFSVAGLTFSFEDSAQKVESAKSSIDKTKNALLELIATTSDPSMKDKLQRVLAEAEIAAKATNSAQEGLQASIRKQEQEISSVSPTTGEGNWVIVVSADKDKGQAQYEVDQLRRLGYKEARIYERKGWLRTVLPFSSRADATEALSTIRKSRRATAYVTDMAAWCPQSQPDASTGFLSCKGVTTSD